VSVAFRRESDEEHKEPRFELPLPAGPNLVTAHGLALIEARVAELEAAAEAAPIVDGPIVEADADAKAAREDAMRTLRYWRTRLSTAQLAPVAPADRIAFGSRVAFRLKGKARSIDIVGGDEAVPAENRIAFFAPLARALIGAEAGEFVDFNGESDAIEILSTGPIPD